jgi:hypothetical protein
MKKNHKLMRLPLLITAILLGLTFLLSAQSTGLRVYEIFQEKCVSCHSHVSPESGLDLQGSGATAEARAAQVFQNIYQATPANGYAATQGMKYIYPGRPDKSFLFRKINQGLDSQLDLHADAGGPMPAYSGEALSLVEQELIRQWILYGAPPSGEVINEQLLVGFFEGGVGLASFSAPPPAPDPMAGFQLKMGPFYLSPGGEPGSEREYFQKYELELPEHVEVTRLDILMSPYSHHFLLYSFDSPAAASSFPDGLRSEALHQGVGLVAAVQESTELALPEGTAFRWNKDLVLDFNSHYINYSANVIYQAEVYINVYTQPQGTAAQEMFSSLLANVNIPIPNNGSTITHSQIINPNAGELFLWGIMGHTHKYGTSYKVYERKNFSQGDLIYDGACAGGIPGCISPYFDYQHIPIRYIEPLMPITMSQANGLIHVASWVNNGPNPVFFGPTSDDEMMVLVLMYTLDTTGLVITHSTEPAPVSMPYSLHPNPAQDISYLHLPEARGEVMLLLHDALGRTVRQLREQPQGAPIAVDLQGLPAGLYWFHATDDSGRQTSGRLIISDF